MLRMSDKLNFILKSSLFLIFGIPDKSEVPFLLFTLANVGLIFLSPKK